MLVISLIRRFCFEELNLQRLEAPILTDDMLFLVRMYFYPLTSAYECLRGIFHSENTSVALQKSRQILTLPIYAGLSLKDVDKICDIIIS